MFFPSKKLYLLSYEAKMAVQVLVGAGAVVHVLRTLFIGFWTMNVFNWFMYIAFPLFFLIVSDASPILSWGRFLQRGALWGRSLYRRQAVRSGGGGRGCRRKSAKGRLITKARQRGRRYRQDRMRIFIHPSRFRGHLRVPRTTGHDGPLLGR